MLNDIFSCVLILDSFWMYVYSHGKEGGALIGGGALNGEFTVLPVISYGHVVF